MFDIVGRRGIYYVVSLFLIVPGLLFMAYSLATNGTILPLSIDYTGGTLWEMRFEQAIAPAEARQVFVDAGYADTQAFHVENEQTIQVKFKNIDISEKESLAAVLVAKFGAFDERSYRSIGPAMGSEVSRAALGAVIVSSVGILLYVAWAYRQVPHAFRYGTCAVIVLVHDVLATISFVALMHFIAGWEVDALFLTAILTIIGYSVNDTIVVFDRIRENVRRHRGESYATVANRSLWETMQRSLSTQMTVFMVLFAIMLFGGASLRQFMATMLVGMVSGAYSTIFVAVALMVAWDERAWLGKRPVDKVTGSVVTA